MSDASEHPAEPLPEPGPDSRPDPAHGPDAWAAACQEDLDAERARRQERYGRPPADPVREFRLLADAVTERLGRLGGGFGLGAGPLVAQARAALEPVIERNADTWQHLAAAGQELLAAYRSAVERQEQTWARPADARAEREPGPPHRGPDDAPEDSTHAADPENRKDPSDSNDAHSSNSSNSSKGATSPGSREPDEATPTPGDPTARRDGDQRPGAAGSHRIDLD